MNETEILEIIEVDSTVDSYVPISKFILRAENYTKNSCSLCYNGSSERMTHRLFPIYHRNRCSPTKDLRCLPVIMVILITIIKNFQVINFKHSVRKFGCYDFIKLWIPWNFMTRRLHRYYAWEYYIIIALAFIDHRTGRAMSWMWFFF
jgi:hypothetical protein